MNRLLRLAVELALAAAWIAVVLAIDDAATTPAAGPAVELTIGAKIAPTT